MLRGRTGVKPQWKCQYKCPSLNTAVVTQCKIISYFGVKTTIGLQNSAWLKRMDSISKVFMAWTVNGASTHAGQLVAVFQVLSSLYVLTCVGYAQNSLQFVSRSPLIHVVGRSFVFTQTACLLKLVIPTKNALPRWGLNVETKTKRTLYSSRRLSFNELTK